MVSSLNKSVTPVALGKEIRAISDSPLAAGSVSERFSIDAEAVLVSVFVQATAGNVTVRVFTIGTTEPVAQELEIITFPVINSPSTELLLRKSASTLRNIRIEVSYTGACSYEIRARGVSAQASSFKIDSASTFRASQKNINNTPQVLIASSLTDRTGVLITNNNVSGSEVLYIGGTLSEADTMIGTPIRPGGNFTLDITGGAELYAVADSGIIDVRISETGA